MTELLLPRKGTKHEATVQQTMTKDDLLGKQSENRIETLYNVSRRNVMKAVGMVAMSGGALTGTAAADEHDDNNTGAEEETGDVDEPEDFSVEVLAPHANFPDDVTAEFGVTYTGGELDPITSALDDASTVVVAKVTWRPGGTSGWHTHPGPVIVTIVEGELELINERDCIARSYTASEAFIDPGQGNIHIANNPSETECAVAYATFLGVPDGAPATEWVEPVDC